MSAKSLEYLQQENIGSVVLAGDNLVARFKDQGIDYLEILVADEPKEDIATHFDTVLDWIVKQRIEKPETPNVLVHCASGISRSATFVTAYLIREKNMDYNSAHTFLVGKRSCVHPNSGFRSQLQVFADQIHK